MGSQVDSPLSDLTDGELIDLAASAGDRTLHRGIERTRLELAALDTLENGPSSGTGPFDSQRVEVMQYLSDREGRIKLHCHGNCFQHSDARVIQCWLRIQGIKTS